MKTTLMLHVSCSLNRGARPSICLCKGGGSLQLGVVWRLKQKMSLDNWMLPLGGMRVCKLSVWERCMVARVGQSQGGVNHRDNTYPLHPRRRHWVKKMTQGLPHRVDTQFYNCQFWKSKIAVWKTNFFGKEREKKLLIAFAFKFWKKIKVERK